MAIHRMQWREGIVARQHRCRGNAVAGGASWSRRSTKRRRGSVADFTLFGLSDANGAAGVLLEDNGSVVLTSRSIRVARTAAAKNRR
jgi:hypothetical protein